MSVLLDVSRSWVYTLFTLLVKRKEEYIQICSFLFVFLSFILFQTPLPRFSCFPTLLSCISAHSLLSSLTLYLLDFLPLALFFNSSFLACISYKVHLILLALIFLLILLASHFLYSVLYPAGLERSFIWCGMMKQWWRLLSSEITKKETIMTVCRQNNKKVR